MHVAHTLLLLYLSVCLFLVCFKIELAFNFSCSTHKQLIHLTFIKNKRQQMELHSKPQNVEQSAIIHRMPLSSPQHSGMVSK